MKFALAFFLCASAAFGQNAQISGLIQDPSASIVARAEISIRNEQTGAKRITTSNETGLYSVPSLRPGVYRVTTRAHGFETIIREGVTLEVGDNVRLDFALRIGDSRTVVTVKGGPPLMNTEDASVGTTIGRDLIDQLPLNGRGIQTLVELTPGVVAVPVLATSAGQWVVNGQRSSANYFTVDGVSANFAVSVGTINTLGVGGNNGSANLFGQAGSGSLAANNLLGNFNNLVPPDALQEFRIQTSSFAPEFGRFPGAAVGLVTRSGTNRYSGSLSEFLRNDATDANDWFSNRLGVSKDPLRFNNFSASLGGPVQVPAFYDGHNRTFFFFSFDGLVMRQPQPPVKLVVPTSETRRAAAPFIASWLKAYPLPNSSAPLPGNAIPGWGTFVGRNFLDHDQRAYGLRADHSFSDRLTGFGSYDQSPSQVLERPGAYTERFSNLTQMLTIGLTQTVGPNLVNEIRLNGSRQRANSSFGPSGFEGAQQPADSSFFPSGYSATHAFVGISTYYGSNFAIGTVSDASARQLQFVDNLSFVRGTHQLKFGADYRWFSPIFSQPELELIYGIGSATNGIAPTVTAERMDTTAYVLPAFSAYGQDTWRATRSLTLTYGLRWEVNPAPHAISGQPQMLRQLTSLNNFSNLSLGSLYPTRYSNFAPRLGIAWEVLDGPAGKTVLRAGAGRFYDLGQSGFVNSFSIPINYAAYSNVPFGSLIPGQPPNTAVGYVAAAPGHTLPRTYEWNLTAEHSFGGQTFSVAYVSALGRRLMGTTTLNLSNASYQIAPFGAIYLFGNEFSSAYHSMQLQFNRRLARRLQVLISYTWSHSIDNLSSDLGTPSGYGSFDNSLDVFLQPNINRGPSDFDIRHNLNGAVLLALPSPRTGIGAAFLRGWSANSVFFARSAPPSDLTTYSSSAGLYVRPDLVPGQPLYLYGSDYPGGKRYNPRAFVTPTAGVMDGNLGRNVLRGFGAWQIDFALHRTFRLSERVGLQFRAEAFNILNHPNFANPASDSSNPHNDSIRATGFSFSSATLASSLGPSKVQGELNPLFQVGGPRTLQFALRLSF